MTKHPKPRKPTPRLTEGQVRQIVAEMMETNWWAVDHDGKPVKGIRMVVEPPGDLKGTANTIIETDSAKPIPEAVEEPCKHYFVQATKKYDGVSIATDPACVYCGDKAPPEMKIAPVPMSPDEALTKVKAEMERIGGFKPNPERGEKIMAASVPPAPKAPEETLCQALSYLGYKALVIILGCLLGGGAAAFGGEVVVRYFMGLPPFHPSC